VRSAARLIQTAQIRLHRHVLDPWQDSLLEIDASGRISASALALEGPNVEESSEYIGTPTLVLNRALDHLRINTERFVFVDFGSGKGRVVLRAALRRFRRVEGVEFSEPLYRICLQNIAKAKAALRSPVVIHNKDVTHFELPDDPLVLYCFNPFGKKIMRALAEKISASLKSRPRECYLIYLNPQYQECFNEGPLKPLPVSRGRAAVDRLISPWPLITYANQQTAWPVG
jgi:hypothetical protein